MSSLQIYVKALLLNVTIFGDRASKEIIKVKTSQKDRILIQQDWYLFNEKRHKGYTCTEPRPCEDIAKKLVICKPTRKASGKTNPASTFNLDFQAPEL